LPPGALDGAPTTSIATARVEPAEETRVQSAVIAAFPNVTAIAVREVIALGATIVNYSSDTNVLRATYAAAVAEIRKPKEKS